MPADSAPAAIGVSLTSQFWPRSLERKTRADLAPPVANQTSLSPLVTRQVPLAAKAASPDSAGGKSWAMQFKCADPTAFFDAIAFWDEKNGMALGDPIKGQFQLITTDDGGANWKPLPAKNLPPALPGEGAFAASGTCLVTHGKDHVWFATGGAKVARVFRSSNRGRTWEVSETPIVAGAESAGIFSIAFRDAQHGMIVGGDYRKPNDLGATAAVTADGGKTWKLLDKRLPYRSAVAWAKDRWIAVGTSGSHASTDNGDTWKLLDRENYNSVAFAPTGEGWAIGPKGRIAKFAK